MEVETETADPTFVNQPKIITYHCICSTLLLATTHNLSSLPRRAEPALDKAFILPLPPASRAVAETTEGDDTEAENHDSSDVGYSLLVSTTQDRKPTIVRREDGFEKRILLRCGRCRLVVGYKLDPAHFEGAVAGTGLRQAQEDTELDSTTRDADGEANVVYLLPGGLASSEDLRSGKTPEVVEWKEWGSKGV